MQFYGLAWVALGGTGLTYIINGYYSLIPLWFCLGIFQAYWVRPLQVWVKWFLHTQCSVLPWFMFFLLSEICVVFQVFKQVLVILVCGYIAVMYKPFLYPTQVVIGRISWARRDFQTSNWPFEKGTRSALFLLCYFGFLLEHVTT